MFVRIVRGASDAIYQCDNLRTKLIESSLFITVEKYGGISYTIDVDTKDPAEVGVYVMNDVGRTIDTLFRKDGD